MIPERLHCFPQSLKLAAVKLQPGAAQYLQQADVEGAGAAPSEHMRGVGLFIERFEPVVLNKPAQMSQLTKRQSIQVRVLADDPELQRLALAAPFGLSAIFL